MRKPNKHGSGSIFIAIILAALILIEGLYLSLIIDVNRRITIDRALKLQVEAILTKYNEELFENYGLYGFLLNDVDDEIFKKAIESTGYTYGEDIFIYGYRTINTVQLKKAISNYYAYRTPGMAIDGIMNTFDFVFEKLEENEFFSHLKKFKSYGGNKVLNFFANGFDTISEFLSSDTISDLIDVSDEDVSFFDSFKNIYDSSNSKTLDFDEDFNPKDMFSMGFFNKTIEVFGDSSNFIENNLFNPYLSHYCIYNFESYVKEFEDDEGNIYLDRNVHGTEFYDLNSQRCTDMEYLITGFDDFRGVIEVGYLVFPMIILIEVVNYLLDEEFMEICNTISEILSAVLTVLLEGIYIPAWVFEMVIVVFFAFFSASFDMSDLYSGKSVNVFEISNSNELISVGLDLNYKDFAYLLSLIEPEEVKLSRLEDLLNQKYGDFLTCIEIGTVYKDDEYYAEMGYELYGF